MNTFTFVTTPGMTESISYAPNKFKEFDTYVLEMAMPEPVTKIYLQGFLGAETIILDRDTSTEAPYIIMPTYSVDEGLKVAIDGDNTFTEATVLLNNIYPATINSTDGTVTFGSVRAGQENNIEISCSDIGGNTTYSGSSSILCLMDPPMICAEYEDGSTIKITWSYPRTNPDIIETVNVYLYDVGLNKLAKYTYAYDKTKNYVIVTDTVPAEAVFAKITYGARSLETDFSRLVKI